MSEKILVVLTDDDHWAQEALHLSAALAKNTRSVLVLAYMVRVPHLSWLNTEEGYANFTDESAAHLKAYEEIGLSYDVEVDVHVIQYYELADAIVDLRSGLGSHTVFATLPKGRFSWFARLQQWHMARRLHQQGCILYTLEESTAIPNISTVHLHG